MKLFTSESVGAGHPDKLADTISDTVLDYVLTHDKDGRVACEVMLTATTALISGEITTTADLSPIKQLVYDTLANVDEPYAKATNIVIDINAQSPEIAVGVDNGGAGDQGLMFGYATNETPELMPLPITIAHAIIREIEKRKPDGILADIKSQVTVKYDDNDTPIGVDTVIVSARHDEKTTVEQVRKIIKPIVIEVVGQYLSVSDIKLLINPAGSFVVGGPLADVGLTGRKIIVDTYGGYARHGGGAFSGKDSTKVDRSAAYMARYIAQTIVRAELADKCEVQLAYAIGVAEPVSVRIDTFGTNKHFEEWEIETAVKSTFDMTPHGITEELNLRSPIFKQTATGGHFGRAGLPWESGRRVNDLLNELEEVYFVGE